MENPSPKIMGFIVAFKPKMNSQNWENDSKLLYETLGSLCNQETDEFKVYVIYHDLPTMLFQHPNVQYIHFPFKFCTINDMLNIAPVHKKDARNVTFIFDQGKKILYGAQIAKSEGCAYVMSVDADDLISRKILNYVKKDNNRAGYFVNKGYIFYTEKKLLLRRRKEMNGINGSTNIVYKDHIPEVDFYNNDVDNFSFYAAHYYLKERLQNTGVVIKPLPFYAIVYRAHISNWFNIHTHMDKFSWKVILKLIFTRHLITKSIKNEFQLLN